MKRLVVLAIVLAVIAVVADFAAKAFAEGKIAEGAERQGGVSTSAEADIRSFPFLPKLLTAGSAGGVNVRIRGFAADRLELALVEIDVGELRLDESKLLQGDGVEVTGISDASVAVEMTGPDLAAATRLPVTIEDGEVRVSVAGQAVAVRPTVSAQGSLQLGAAGVAPAALGLERSGISACTSTSVEVQGDRLRIECRTEEVPRFLLEAAARRGP